MPRSAPVDLARHALDAESRPVQWHLNLDVFGVDKVSTHRRVAAILDRARPVGVSRADFLVFMALRGVLALRTLQGEVLTVDADLGTLIEREAPVRAPDAELGPSRPLRETVEGRPSPLSDGAMRELANQRKTPR